MDEEEEVQRCPNTSAREPRRLNEKNARCANWPEACWLPLIGSFMPKWWWRAGPEYSRGNDKVWIYGALRIRDGQEITKCAAARNSKNYVELLTDIEADNPTGDLSIVTDNLSSHNSRVVAPLPP